MDRLELQDLLERHHADGFGWALSCCSRNREEAETVLQTVYVKILDGKARFEGKSTFKTWLCAVIRKTAAEERRRQWLNRLRLAGFEKRAISPVATARPDEALYQSQIQTQFRQALAALPKQQQTVLQLVFYHDLSLQEASDAMGVSLGAVRVHYQRGKKRLRQWLEKAKVSHEL